MILKDELLVKKYIKHSCIMDITQKNTQQINETLKSSRTLKQMFKERKFRSFTKYT